MRGSLFGAVLLIASCAGPGASSPPGVSFTPSAREVELFDLFEIDVRVDRFPGALNPFVDAALTGRFRREGEAPSAVDGFCDAADGSRFRIRFMPSRFGTHAYELTLRIGGEAHAYRGTFKAREGKRPGPVRVDKVYPWHFVREGSGEHWYLNGATALGILGWDEPTMLGAADRLAGLKVNRIRAALTMRVLNGRVWSEDVFPTERYRMTFGPWVAKQPADVEAPGYDVKRFDVAFWRHVETLVRRCREKDVVLSLVFTADGRRPGADPFGQAERGGPDEQRLYRYAVARLAAFGNVAWELADRYREMRSDAWAEQMGAFVKDCDPYDLLTSVGGHADFRFPAAPWADVALYRRLDEAGGNAFILQGRRMHAGARRLMPQVNDDYGAEDHYPPGAPKPPGRDAESRRRLAWEIAMAGGYSSAGETARLGTGSGADAGGGWVNGRGDASMTMLTGQARIAEFFTSVEWWRLEPRNERLQGEGFALAEPGKRVAVYQPRGKAAALGLEPGSWRLRRFDPRSGAWDNLPPVEGPQWTVPAGPEGADWAWLLER
jgi:hypothetical protein